MSLLERKAKRVHSTHQTEYTMGEYLELCKKDPTVYSTAAQRMLRAIGEPQIIDTSKNPRLGRIHMNRTIRTYPAFAEFYGMEETIERLVNFFRFAAQGLEESKQIVYLLGPVGGGKSSLAEKVKELIEKEPIYVLKHGKDVSPLFESPLGLFNGNDAKELHEEYGIPSRLINGLLSPWGVKRLEESENDISQFSVVKLFPSKLKQIGVTKVEPGDENNQDISTLVGKTDMRKLEFLPQNDPDAYSYSGGLNRATQGVLEFVEMFKAPIKMLHPLLTATQEGNYVGTETIGAMPFRGIILAHSNEAEWQTFKNNKNNEAFIDRIYLIKVPYCLRASEEAEILKKLVKGSELVDANCAPDTLEMLARFAVLSRLTPIDNGDLYSKMKIYDGETMKDRDPNAKSLSEYMNLAGPEEGMHGVISTRFEYKILSQTFNFDATEIAADPVHLMYVIETTIKREQFPDATEKALLNIIKKYIAPKYAEYIGKEIQTAYIESYNDYGQNLFDRYVSWADAWIEETDFKDPDTGQMMDRKLLDEQMSSLEKPSGIANPKDFRNEIVKFALRARANNNGNNPSWKSFEKIRDVIEKKMFGNLEDLLPVISFGVKTDSKLAEKHNDFLDRMKSRGYTEKQIRRLVEWYIRVKQAS